MKKIIPFILASIFVCSIAVAGWRAISEDFTLPQWVETDGPGKVTITTSTITLTNGDRDEDYYVTCDSGVGAITDFTHWIDVNVTAQTDNDNSLFIGWGVSNADDDLKDITDASGESIHIVLQHSGSATTYKFVLRYATGGAVYVADQSFGRVVGTPYYLSISRSNTTVTVQVYSTSVLRSAGGAGDLDTLTGVCINTTFQYLYGLSSYNTGGTAKDISGTVSNLVIDPIYISPTVIRRNR